MKTTFRLASRQVIFGAIMIACVSATFAGVAKSAFAQHDHGGHGAPSNEGVQPTVKATNLEDATQKEMQGGEDAQHEEAGPARPNWTDTTNKAQPPYIAALLNFLILAGVYWYFGKGPIAKGLIERRNTIQKQIEEAQQMKEDAQERAKQYQAKLANLDSELEATKSALLDAGKNERDRIVQEAEEKAARMTRDAQFLIDQEMKTMIESLRRQTIETAIVAAEDLLKKGLTPDDQTRLADEYLAELATKPSKPSARPGNLGSSPALGGAS